MLKKYSVWLFMSLVIANIKILLDFWPKGALIKHKESLAILLSVISVISV